jgi:hypothetical protein
MKIFHITHKLTWSTDHYIIFAKNKEEAIEKFKKKKTKVSEEELVIDELDEKMNIHSIAREDFFPDN